MVNEDKTLQIVNICLKIDQIAHQAYYLLSMLSDNETMKNFWFEMAEDKDLHIRYWQSLQKLSEKWNFPEVFDNQDVVLFELKSIIPKANALLERFKKQKDIISAITLAYRLEFYLLYPQIAELFHFLNTAKGKLKPRDAYDDHINKFIIMLNTNAETTFELELIGETLQRLWHENKKLSHQVSTDSLTNVLNRRGFFALATQMAHLSHRQGSTVGVMMIDIDDFKKVNDTYGHQVGDTILKDVSQIIVLSSRVSDIIGRYGGEEFCVFMPDVDVDDFVPVAERIRKAIFEARPNGLVVSVSIGACVGKMDVKAEKHLHEMLRKADENLYKAKKSGKNKVVL